jgi:cytoskeletal protein RodZ
MFERFSRKTMVATGAALLAAVGVSGAAIAQTGSGPPSQEKPGAESNAPETTASGQKQQEAPGSEQSEASEKPESGSEKPGSEGSEGSEKANDDGPGGHADEPGNPDADHQSQGKE